MIVEAMRQALEAMELEMKGYAAKHDRLMPAAHALRTAIAEAEKQEPVAWMWHQAPVKTQWGDDMVVADIAIDKDHTVSIYCERDQAAKVEAMFTPPAAQRQSLTEEQIKALFPSPDGSAEADVVKVEVSPGIWGTEYSEIDAWSYPLVLQVARAIEAAHGIKEKNT